MNTPSSNLLTNTELACYLRAMAQHRARSGASWYRVVAYHKAAQVVAELPQSLAEEICRGIDPTRHPWIGQKIARQLRQIVGVRAPVQLTFNERLATAA